MKTASLLKQIREQGVDIKLSGENLELIFQKERISDDIINLIKENKPSILTYLKLLTAEGRSEQIPLVAEKKVYPITSSQLRFWILCQMEEINKAYNLPLVIRLEGQLRTAVLEAAFDHLVGRHEILRTHFTEGESNMIAQKILEKNAFQFEMQQISINDQQILFDAISKFIQTPFELKDAPLFKACLIRKDEQEHYLCLNIHHIIADGASLEILLAEIMHVYNALIAGRPVELAPLRIQFKDYAAWTGNENRVKEEEAYWLEKFTGELPVINLPTYKVRPALKTYSGSVHVHAYDQQLLQNMRAFASRNKGTLFMVLMANVNALLYRYTSQTDIIIGTPISGRSHPDLQGQIGLYINTLPIRMQFEPNTSFSELFALQKRTMESVYAHSNYSFGDLVGKLNLSRDVSRSPLFDILVTHQQQNDNSFQLASGLSGLKSSFYNDANGNVSKYDITFTFFENENSLSVSIEYNTDLFQQEFICHMANNLENFMRESLVNEQEEIQKIRYLDKEQEQLLHSFNNTALTYDKAGATVISLFQQQVKKASHAIALICEGKEISYQELDERSTQLASYLKYKGVKEETIVGVCLGRSIEMMIGILAIFKSGGVYLPMDPFYPLDRIDYIAAHSCAKFILTDARSGNIVSNTVTKISVDDPAVWKDLGNDVLPVLSNTATAYVIYTSGSTGKPKGVKVSHQNLLNFIAGMDQRFVRNTTSDVWLAMTSISFDISILELVWTLTRGDKVVIHLERPVPVQPKPEMDFSLFYFPTGVTQSETNKYKLLLEGSKFADKNGFKAIWVPERHFHTFGDQFPNPSVAAAAVSTITEHIRIRSGSVVLPLHDTVRVAEEWSMIDNLSGGRVELSIASGWHPNDFILAPQEYENRHQSMRDKITTLKNLWQGQPLTRKNGIGKDFEFTIHPKPIQEKLPLWITAAGSIDTFKYAGSIGANVLTHLLGQSIEDLSEKIKIYRETLLENGFDPEKGKVALMVHTFVSDNADMVREVVELPFKNYLKNSLNLLKPFADEQGLDLKQDEEMLLDMGFKRYFNTSSLFGTPESCLDIINKIYEAGVNEIACLIDFGVEEELVINNLMHLFKLKEQVRRSKIQSDFIAERMGRLTEKEEAPALIARYHVTNMQSTPSFYEELLMHTKGIESLKKIQTLLVGGEALKKSLAEKLLETRRRAVHNMYGPTETTIWSTVKMIERPEEVTIGKPIANTHIYILDALQQLCPIGVAGELCIGGDGVSLGYLDNENLTASKFITDPFVPHQRLYRTGDLARWLPNGELECLGRLDRQVKINGYRIELEEIENVILTYSGIIQCIVTASQIKNQQVLVAYITLLGNVKDTVIKDFLRLRLPAYMVPQHVIILDEFPFTPNGKIDHLQLPHPDESKMTVKKFIPPKDEVEEALVKAWKEFLKMDKISVEDNFFEIGGNSLKAFQLLPIINKVLDTDLKIIALFQHPTIRNLANSLNRTSTHKKVLIEENEMEDIEGLIDFMDKV